MPTDTSNPLSLGKKFDVEGEWKRYLKKRRRTEKEYFFFSVRMMSYGFSSVFLTLFFVVKLSKNMNFSDQILTVFYLTGILLVIFLVFMDAKRFNRQYPKTI